MNHDRRRPVLLALLLLASAGVAAGEFKGEPFVSYRLQQDSNVFRVEDRAQAEAINGTPERADTIQRYGAGLALQYSFGLQRAFVGAEIDRDRYQRFRQLDHDSNKIRGGLDWKLGHVASGHLLAQQERRIESFVGRDTGELGLQHERKLAFDGLLAMTPNWALQSQLNTRQLRNTRTASRDYDLDEHTASLGGLYTGLPVGQAGATVEYVRGRFPDRAAAPGLAERYAQVSTRLNAAWQPSGLSSLRAELGYTQRNNEGPQVQDFSGLTGRLAYQRQWSGKTQLRAEAFRRVVSVDQVDANFIAETGLGLGVDWQLLTKLGLFGTGAYLNDDYRGAPLLGIASESRRDRVKRAELGLEFKPWYWLKLSPSVTYERRLSNRALSSYDDYLIGLDIEARAR